MAFVGVYPSELRDAAGPGWVPDDLGRLTTRMPSASVTDDRNLAPARLVAEMAEGDRRALAQLYDEFSGPVYSLAVRLLGDQAEAQDLVQEIFLQVWLTAGSYEPGRGTVFSWLVTLTRNRAIDRIRKRRRRAELLSEAAPDLQPAAPAGDGDSATALWFRERAAAVQSALAEVPPDQKQAIELAFFGGLTQQEIAARLNEPLGTIKARIRRGLLRLKDRLSARL
ncbi:MAG TPA: sigma-70 family RNA polymerase sigma factor [Lacunisphaera sp.]